MQTEEVTIIGAGPAGLSAALQLKRYGITPKILETGEIGGLLRNANLVENYPGFPEGIGGRHLVKLFQKQAKHHSITITQDTVTELAHDGEVFQVTTPEHIYTSRVVVIASGTKPKTFTSFSIPNTLQDKVFYEVHPLLNEAGKHITIVGAGDAAFDYALNLGKQNLVTILNRGQQITCLPLLWERVCTTPNITYRKNINILEISEAPQAGMSLICKGPSATSELKTDYLVGAIGRVPQLDYVPKQMLVKFHELETQGVLYQVGDVRNDIYRQTSIAVGQGILAAMKIYRYFKEQAR